MDSREAVYAGHWYPGEEAALRQSLTDFMAPHEVLPKKVHALVAPHAGYVHSGSVAGFAYGAIAPPKVAVVLCPNHRDRRLNRPSFAVAPHPTWKTPLGEIGLDLELSAKIVEDCVYADFDGIAHSEEHSIELQIPFLQLLNPEVKLVAISIGSLNLKKLDCLAVTLVKHLGDEALIIASSDMTHYESRTSVLAKDKRALEKVINFDGPALLEICDREEITMCGRGPVVVALKCSELQGASEVRLLCHDTSRASAGVPDGPVVGYAALAIL
jgi:MEMO1 family protein